jgi:predicted transcriptional regulator|tara:strand:- start:836 stop:1270 length:435 start_codon:yes stop_codon:yes gene_type:complete
MQQLEATGFTPGLKNTKPKRKRAMAWDDDKKAQAVTMYEAAEPTPETSMEIVKDIAEELDESPNGVRMILTKAGVYVKKTPAAKSSSSTTGGGGTARVSKAAAAEALTAALSDAGQSVDEEIIAKLTGKASQYFTSIIIAINEA